MDDYVSKVLSDWNLSLLQNLFRFHKIDKTRFFCLTEDEISEIIPKELGNEIISDFKLKYKLNLVSNLNDNVDIVNNTEEENIDVLNLTVTNDEAFDIDNINIENLSCDENIEKLQNIENFYSSIERNMPLFQLLCSTLVGRFILYEYSKTKTFSRKDLCRIVIENAINKTIGTLMPFS
ncbi:uncharacterized protein LOC122497623 [Leptopilina heterotoma]|uniref:uncharacterized protein LOC122497622 n=1 Tax=Leptopilina heterotoma TaxID=63436 RepID=UPI001CA7C775|nr:uncharacterized protein LOC122497622 [Leptopilina heterotoma]XP_043460793.1 uncharacterized protein LOC122497623 [Leptopilina heterotoma]